MKLINATRAQSVLGTVVKQSPSKNGSFVYADGTEKGNVYVVAEGGVPHGSSCEVKNTGDAEVMVRGSYKGGDIVRLRQSSDKKATGACFKASDSDVPYLKIGKLLEPGRNGLLRVNLDIQYVSALNSDGTAWEDLRAPATGINPAGQVSPPTVNSADGSLSFSTADAICIWFQLPHSYKEGSDVILHIHWSKSSTASGTVNWQTKYKWANRGSVMPSFSALVSGTEVTPNSNVTNKHALLEFTDLSGTSKTISSMLCVYLVRTASGDSYGAEANLYEVDLHYQIDSMGSKTEYVK